MCCEDLSNCSDSEILRHFEICSGLTKEERILFGLDSPDESGMTVENLGADPSLAERPLFILSKKLEDIVKYEFVRIPST